MIDMEILGKKFNRITVVSFSHSNKGHYYFCKCECGNERIVKKNDLTSGKTKSCGCYNQEVRVRNHQTHGLSKDENGNVTALYSAWVRMKSRCFRKKDKDYKYYGGRGITICAEWITYKPFHEWAISNGYSIGLSLERERVNGNYESTNCKWIPVGDQQLNTRRTVRVTINGVTRTTREWSKITGVSNVLILGRLKDGWDSERAINTPARKHKPYQQFSTLQ